LIAKPGVYQNEAAVELGGAWLYNQPTEPTDCFTSNAQMIESNSNGIEIGLTFDLASGGNCC
jgi:hypothetical protein